MSFVTEERSLWVLLKSIPKRLAELVIKMISTKGLILAIAVFLAYRQVLDSWALLVVFFLVIGGKTLDKFLDKFSLSK